MKIYNKLLRNEHKTFEECHKNKLNLSLHFILGLIYTFLILDYDENNKIGNLGRIMYFVLISKSMNDYKISYYLILSYIFVKIIKDNYNFPLLSIKNYNYKVVLSLVAYFSIELSHIITQENSAISPSSSFISYLINYFYLLPFTISVYTN